MSRRERGSWSAGQRLHCMLDYHVVWPPVQEAERVQRMDTKLKSLHLDGLVDCDDKAARSAMHCHRFLPKFSYCFGHVGGHSTGR